MRGLSKDATIAVGFAALVVATMAVDHLLGTEDDPGDESGLADPGTFALGVGVSLALLALLFVFVVRRRQDPESAAKAGIVSSALSIPALALLFLAVQLPLAATGIALGLRGREGKRARLGATAAAIGALVTALTVVAYAVALA